MRGRTPKRKMKVRTPCLKEREDRGKLSEGKSVKSEATMGCSRISCSGENCEHHNGRLQRQKCTSTTKENIRPKNRQWSPKEIDRIDSNKNTPDLQTLVTTHQSERKEQPSPLRRKNLTLSSDRRGLQTVKENELLCSLIRTAHEIHYR